VVDSIADVVRWSARSRADQPSAQAGTRARRRASRISQIGVGISESIATTRPTGPTLGGTSMVTAVTTPTMQQPYPGSRTAQATENSIVLKAPST